MLTCSSKRLEALTNIPTLAACADACAANPLCQSCDYNVPSKNCVLFDTYIPTIPYEGVNTWFPTSKRPDPSEDPTFHSCPNDDGKTFNAEDGTFFRVKCQVHTIASNNPADKIQTVPTESIQDCMEACSTTKGCLSVDYVQRNGDHKLKDCDLYKTGGGDTPETSCASSMSSSKLLNCAIGKY